MLLGVIPMFFFFFEILRSFGEKSKMSKVGNRAPMPQRREPTPRRRPTPLCGKPRRGEAEGPKWYPLGTPRLRPTLQRSSAMSRRSYSSQ